MGMIAYIRCLINYDLNKCSLLSALRILKKYLKLYLCVCSEVYSLHSIDLWMWSFWQYLHKSTWQRNQTPFPHPTSPCFWHIPSIQGVLCQSWLWWRAGWKYSAHLLFVRWEKNKFNTLNAFSCYFVTISLLRELHTEGSPTRSVSPVVYFWPSLPGYVHLSDWNSSAVQFWLIYFYCQHHISGFVLIIPSFTFFLLDLQR